MSNILSTFGKIIASLAKGYGKQTAKKREKEDAKLASNKDQKTVKNG